jgi:hemin uptake protein HemP
MVNRDMKTQEVPNGGEVDSSEAPPRLAEPPAVTSDSLLRGGRELVIRHGDETYRLLLTRNNNLILQK